MTYTQLRVRAPFGVYGDSSPKNKYCGGQKRVTTHPRPKSYGIKFFTIKCAWEDVQEKNYRREICLTCCGIKKNKNKKLKIQIVMLVYIGLNSKKLGLVVDACNPRSLRG